MAKGVSSIFSRTFLFACLIRKKARVKVQPVLTWLLILGLPVALVQSTLVSASAPASNARAVYGQPDLHSNANNNGGLSASSLYNPQGIAADTTGVFVADIFNNRVLHFPLNSNVADMVYGQPDATHNSANQGGAASASTLNYPIGVALDNSGGLFVADNGNNRVLYYPAGSTTATRVYGQGAGCNNFAATAAASGTTGLHGPYGVTVDSSGGIYVSDTINNRVLYFPSSGSCTATRVYGQGAAGNSFNTTGSGSTATTLNLPYAAALDNSGGLFVADNVNNRVVYYPANSFTATRVYGQADLNSHTFGTSPTTLHNPSGLVLDSTGGLYVTDFINNRVVYYQVGATTATRVYGQPSYNSNTANYGGLGPASLQAPFGIAMNSDGILFVSDSYNNRVISFQPVGEYANSIAAAVYGQPDFNTNISPYPHPDVNNFEGPYQMQFDHTGGLYIVDQGYNRVLYYPAGSSYATKVYGNGPSGNDFTSFPHGRDATHMDRPFGLALDSNDGLYVSDFYNNRVLYFPAGSFTATKVYGQPDFTSGDAGVSKETLFQPGGIALDAQGGLYVADTHNNRVVYYPPTPAPATSISATRVYGQGPSGTNFTSRLSDATPTSMSSPIAATVDAANGVYISDSINSRILYFPSGSVIPTRVYGQTDFYSGGYGTSANRLHDVSGLALDAIGGLYAVDYANYRVVYFPAGSTTATRVYGQPDFTTSAQNYGGAVTASSLYGPVFAALDNNQNLYVADLYNNRLLRYNYLPDCTPLTVTNPLDDGSNCTLRATLMQAHSGDTVTINFGAPATIHLQSSLGTLPPNLTLQGLCNATGPAITLDGSGVKSAGVQLSGGDHLVGLKIKGFEGNQLKITTSQSKSPNVLSCVSASR